MQRDKPGSLIGGMLLIGGSCLGAGMLALPILTGLSGFFPSFILFIAAWAFMKSTALLILEVNGWFSTPVNIFSMTSYSLGKVGKILSATLYLFLFYSLLVAYISGSGGLGTTYFKVFFNTLIPHWVGSLFFVLLFGWIVYVGTKAVDHCNRFLMFGKIFTYLGLIFLGIKYIQPSFLLRTDTSYTLLSLPVLIVAFGYHNMIPTLTTYMKGDLKRVRKTLYGGSLLALLIYLIWELVVLGIVPFQGEWGLLISWQKGRLASDSITGILGLSWVSTFAEGLAFFALLTSFLTQTLALVHFLADFFKTSTRKTEPFSLCCLALVPPLIFSLIYPDLFIKALNFAGGICAVILFGILPALIVWIGRYKKQTHSPYQVAGGKPLLVGVFLFALFILFFQISSMVT